MMPYQMPHLNEFLSLNSCNRSATQGRHPVMERMPNCDYQGNDTYISDSCNLHIITGPNMAGKSTYLKQVMCCSCFTAVTRAICCKVPLMLNAHTSVTSSIQNVARQSMEPCKTLYTQQHRTLAMQQDARHGAHALFCLHRQCTLCLRRWLCWW